MPVEMYCAADHFDSRFEIFAERSNGTLQFSMNTNSDKEIYTSRKTILLAEQFDPEDVLYISDYGYGHYRNCILRRPRITK